MHQSGLLQSLPHNLSGFQQWTLFSTPITCVFHRRSAVALFRPAICSTCLLIPGFGGENHLCLGHAVFREERRSKRSAGTGEASARTWYISCLLSFHWPELDPWPSPKQPPESTTGYMALGEYVTFFTEMWVGVSDCKP